MSKQFDVIFFHNDYDKLMAMEIAKKLEEKELRVRFSSDLQNFSFQVQQQIIETTKTAVILVGKERREPWKNAETSFFLQTLVNHYLTVIPVLLPGVVSCPELPNFLKNYPWVNLQYGINNRSLSLLIMQITGLNQALETSKEIVKAAIDYGTNKDREERKLNQQIVDVWGMASVKNYLHEISEIAAGKASEMANLAADIYKYDVLTLLVPLLVELRWHRGYKSALNILFELKKREKRLKDFQYKELVCPVTEGVLSAKAEDNGQVVILLDQYPAIRLSNLDSSEIKVILDSVNLHGRLGIPASQELLLFDRINQDVKIGLPEQDLDALAFFKQNQEVLIPLIARMGMPGDEWLLPQEEDFPPIGEGLIENLLIGQGGKQLESSQEEYALKETFFADDFG